MPVTIAQAQRAAARELTPYSDAPDIDAARLLLHVLGQKESSYLAVHGNAPLSPAEATALDNFIKRRVAGEPLAYVLGSWDFYGRPFIVTPDVLIPRPATEALIDEALIEIEKMSIRRGRPLTVADIGTGSGCIAITLAREAKEKISHIFATDISQPALDVARKNAAVHSLEKCITFVQGSMTAAIVNKKIDLIVCNPPYVPSHELQELTSIEKRGLAFEPRNALDGGKRGQDFSAAIEEFGTPAIVEVTSGTIEKYNFEI